MLEILNIIITGDFPGYLATGVEEDSPIITVMLTMHGLFF